MYLEGKGTKKKVKQAIKWWKKGAELGDSYSQFGLANLYVIAHHDVPACLFVWVVCMACMVCMTNCRYTTKKKTHARGSRRR